jgi:hypothetical protein
MDVRDRAIGRRLYTICRHPHRTHLSLLSGAFIFAIFMPLETPRDDFSPETEVVVPARTFPRADPDAVSAFLHSMKAQSFVRFQVMLLNSEEPSEVLFSHLILSLRDSRFSTVPCTTYIGFAANHSYGYPVTEEALNYVLKQAKRHVNMRYVLITNADNLYHREFLITRVASFE